MSAIERFEDIEAWKKARILVSEIYSLTGKSAFAKDYGLRDQLRRAGISIMLNIAEGFGRKTDREFSHFLISAHGSAAEVQSALYIASDLKYIGTSEFDKLYNLTDEISKMVMSLTKYLLGKSKKSVEPDSKNSMDSTNSF